MTLMLELRPEEEQYVEMRARSEGVLPADYVQRLVARDLEREEQQRKTQRALAWLDKRITEAQTMSDEEKAQGETEWREIKRDLDEWRTSPRKLFPKLTTEA